LDYEMGVDPRQVESKLSFIDRPIVPIVLVGAMFATGLIAACLIAFVG